MPVSSSVSPVVDELSSQFGKQSLSSSSSCSSSEDTANKTSQNITESVPVPSSEHVAEIVGRQGCKIKALRAKTNTYIKTPIRGETPMFVITGRREDVLTAKREIQLAADHFSQIRARRGTTGQLSPVETTLVAKTTTSPKLIPQVQSGSSSLSSSASISPTNNRPTESILTAKPVVRSNSTSPNTVDGNQHNHNHNHHHQYQHQHQQQHQSSQGKVVIQQVASTAPVQLQPGQVCKKVTVPYQVVGLVVGPKGSTIKRIQQNTNTYIVTPSRDSQPVFEIQGMVENVEAAKLEIENYIMLRTTSQHGAGNASSSSSSSSSCSNVEFGSLNGLMVGTVDGDDFNPNQQHSHHNQVHPCHYQLMSPQSTSLFQSVVSVVDDFIPKSSNSSIWSSNNNTNNNKLCDDLFLNSMQPQHQPQAHGNPNGPQRSSSSSCSSSTSSSFSSSSFCAGSNDATLGTNSLLAQSSFSSMLLNDSSTSGSAFDFAIQPPQLHLSSSSSPAVVNQDLLLNSLFSQQSQPANEPQPPSLLFAGLNQPEAADQYNFYYFNAPNNANNSLDAQNFI